MAAITSAVVTVIRSWEAGDRGGAFVEIVKDVHFTLSTQGGTALDIPPSAFGMTKFHSVSSLGNDSTGVKAIPLAIATDGSEMLTYALTDATDGTRATRANVSGEVYARITGLPAA